MEILKLVLTLLVILLPLIFKKGIPYDEGIKILNDFLAKKRKEFEGMSNEKKSLAFSNLIDDLRRVIELRKS